MKIRNGFVSNSSSSSFVLYIRDEADYIYPRLIEGIKYFSLQHLKKELKESKLNVQFIKNKKEKPIFATHLEYLKTKLIDIEKLVKDYKNLSDKEKFECVLKYYNYIPGISDLGDLSISGHTTMFNDITDCGEVFVSIIQYLKDHEIKHMFNNDGDYL